jgi:hypothetical protein
MDNRTLMVIVCGTGHWGVPLNWFKTRMANCLRYTCCYFGVHSLVNIDLSLINISSSWIYAIETVWTVQSTVDIDRRPVDYEWTHLYWWADVWTDGKRGRERLERRKKKESNNNNNNNQQSINIDVNVIT